MTDIQTKKKKTKSVFETVLIVVFCSFLLSISTSMFLNPVGLYAGGVTGIAQIILHFFGLVIKQDYNAYENWLGL
ncbi:MAG: YitT family protein, partial [Bacillales bacterium]|nr:YitT family protein [Bacillales bacterium]